MSKVFAWIASHKTYITVGVGFVMGGLQATGVTIPPWVYVMLTALGVGFVRRAVTTETAKAVDAANEATGEASLTDAEKK